MRKFIFKGMLGLVLAVFFVNARAVPVAAVDFGAFAVSFTPQDNINVGWTFSTNNAFNITSLGYYDFDQDGLNISHQVGIWSDDGNLLTSTFVSPTDTLIGDFRYAEITDFLLDAGETYFVTTLAGGNDAYVGVGANPFSFAPDVNYLAGAASSGTVFEFPTFGTGQEPSIFGPSFLLESLAPIPIPAAIWLFASALIGVIGFTQRSKAAAVMPTLLGRFGF